VDPVVKRKIPNPRRKSRINLNMPGSATHRDGYAVIINIRTSYIL